VANDAARFQPAGTSAVRAPGGAAAGFGGGGGGGPGGGFAAQNAAQMQELGLSKEQQDKLDAGRKELFAQMRAQQPQGGGLAAAAGGGFNGGGNQQGQAMRARMENLMRSVLTPEQLQKWEAQRSARGNGGVRVRGGTLYTLVDGAPKANTVRLGLADDRYTEIVGGELKEGETVVTRSRTQVKK